LTSKSVEESLKLIPGKYGSWRRGWNLVIRVSMGGRGVKRLLIAIEEEKIVKRALVTCQTS
jgi:hypothetical protein